MKLRLFWKIYTFFDLFIEKFIDNISQIRRRCSQRVSRFEFRSAVKNSGRYDVSTQKGAKRAKLIDRKYFQSKKPESIKFSGFFLSSETFIFCKKNFIFCIIVLDFFVYISEKQTFMLL